MHGIDTCVINKILLWYFLMIRAASPSGKRFRALCQHALIEFTSININVHKRNDCELPRYRVNIARKIYSREFHLRIRRNRIETTVSSETPKTGRLFKLRVARMRVTLFRGWATKIRSNDFLSSILTNVQRRRLVIIKFEGRDFSIGILIRDIVVKTFSLKELKNNFGWFWFQLLWRHTMSQSSTCKILSYKIMYIDRVKYCPMK